MRTETRAISKIRKGRWVRIVWCDACEGNGGPSLGELGGTLLRQFVTSKVSTIGRYLRVIGGYVVLSDVLREEADHRILYERKARGKWLAIPLAVVKRLTPLNNIDTYLVTEVRRRRTIFKQIRFLPRSRRLDNGKVSRMLYLA